MNKVLILLAALAALVLASPVAAQTTPEAPAPEAAAAPAPEISETDTDASAIEAETDTDASATEAEKDLERDLSLFWGKRREVKVVQKRLFQKDGKFEVTAYGSIIPNDDFIVYYPLGMRVGYHLSEAFAVEGSFAYALNADTDLAAFLTAEGIELKRADIQEKIEMYYNVSLLWAPIYGKISLMGQKLTHFETYVGVGLGLMHTDEFPTESGGAADKAVKAAGHTVLGFRWFITDLINVRTEYRQYFFEKFDGGVSIPVELSVGLGFIL